jgi:hypothetical protein
MRKNVKQPPSIFLPNTVAQKPLGDRHVPLCPIYLRKNTLTAKRLYAQYPCAKILGGN